jgi:hypothetical protein
MVVTKIHRVIEFKQSKWMQKYIDFNSEQRKLATNEHEKNFFKLMNNSVFGKTMENLRKHQDVQLVPDGRRFRRLVSKPNFKSFKIFTEDLVGVHMTRTEVKLLKPTYVGFSILEMSKTLMFSFHYDNIVSKYGSRAKLLMTDTDSLVYHIETADVYKDMLDDIDAYDTSDYPANHMLFDNRNKKVVGKFKDETCGRPIKEFVGLRPKMYSLLEADNRATIKAKGIAKRAAKAKLKHEAYRSTLFDETSSTIDMQQIRSFKHDIYSIEVTKTCLSPYDDKRYVLNDKISTLAYGHYKIQQLPSVNDQHQDINK